MGSHRRRKAVTVRAQAQQTVHRQRQDFYHQTALALVRQDDVRSHEEVRVAHLVKNHHLAKRSSDAGWRAFLTSLTFKAARAGRAVRAVDPACTSQVCSGCGKLVRKGLLVRWHDCPDCGTGLHRDHHAASIRHWRGSTILP